MEAKALETIKFNGKIWFADDKLEEIRNVDNIHERIKYSELEDLTDFLGI
ncbi:hypothetical protein LCGC14_2154100 [marine sediment metagenome]|uniref:Uncharacterized protein n=1 Tax=marine sediment metagenome TaxID=412755 RepID=A0A0F9DUL2_9ZZZZ